MSYNKVNSPDCLLNDKDSKFFYVLRDEKLAICKLQQELPYWRNRTTYLASGRFSPKHKKVVFTAGSINPSRAMQLLIQGGYITDDYIYAISDNTTKHVKTPDEKKDDTPFSHLSNIRQQQIKSLLDDGMVQQAIQKPS